MKFKDTNYGDLTNKIYENNINIKNVGLISLEGIPKEIRGFINCSDNKLKTLKGLENSKIDGDFNCNKNNLKTLKNSPKLVNGNFDCGNNKLISLEGSPEIIEENFILTKNELVNLKGSPKEIKGNFLCGANKLETLEGCSKIIGGVLECRFNTNLKNVRKQIIENQIKAERYITDEGSFSFEEIEKEFIGYSNMLLKKEELKRKKEFLKINKKKLNQNDYGLGI